MPEILYSRRNRVSVGAVNGRAPRSPVVNLLLPTPHLFAKLEAQRKRTGREVSTTVNRNWNRKMRVLRALNHHDFQGVVLSCGSLLAMTIAIQSLVSGMN